MSLLHFRIADIILAVELPESLQPKLPESFRPFATGPDRPDMILRVTTAPAPLLPDGSDRLLDRTTNDLGTVSLYTLPTDSGTYLFTLSTADASAYAPHAMTCPADFSEVTIHLRPSATDIRQALNSLIRIAFSQRILLLGGISIHASAVCSAGRAIIFLGKSGTGKSTHARLWTETIPETHLINDDNPILRLRPDGPRVYGSPWSGKTPCYRAESHPLSAIVRLSQAPENQLTHLLPIQAFTTILPSCSVIKSSPLLHPALLDTLQTIAATTPTALLACLPHPSAATLAATLLNPSAQSALFTPSNVKKS